MATVSVSATSGGPKGIETLSKEQTRMNQDWLGVSATSGGPKGIETTEPTFRYPYWPTRSFSDLWWP